MIIKNIGPRNRFPGESNCEFRGKEVPCMLYWRKKEGFTSEIITDWIYNMYNIEIFPRVDGILPFLIVGGHWSILEFPLLNYINDTNNCFGLTSNQDQDDFCQAYLYKYIFIILLNFTTILLYFFHLFICNFTGLKLPWLPFIHLNSCDLN